MKISYHALLCRFTIRELFYFAILKTLQDEEGIEKDVNEK